MSVSRRRGSAIVAPDLSLAFLFRWYGTTG
jgi:hypothetical protein